MHLNQIVITFTHAEKYQLENIIGGFRTEPKDSKLTDRHHNNRQDLEFKNNIVNFIKSKKSDLQDKSRCIDRLRELLIEEKCIQNQPNSLLQSAAHDEIVTGLQNLRMKISEINKNNQIFELFIGFMEEMKDLKEEHIYQFEYKLSKATKLNRMERQTLALIAKKLVKVDSLSKLSDIQDDISGFFSKVIRYGIHQEFKELERINSLQIKNKCFKLLEYLQNNCIEMKQQFNPVRTLLKKMSISIYDKSDILNNLSELPENIRLIFEPVCLEIFRLREGTAKTSFIGQAGLTFVSHDMKKAQELNLESLKKEKEELKKKHASVESQMKRAKLILQKLGHMSNLFREESLYQTIQGQLGNCSQDLKIYLERIYQHLKSFEELTLGARKASFIERKDQQIEFLQQKLRIALQQLEDLKSSKVTIQQQESILIDQNSELQSQTSQNVRIINQYQTEMGSLNAQIIKYSKQISQLEGEACQSEKRLQFLIKENAELNKQIENLLNLRKEQEKEEQNQMISMNKQLQKQMKALKQQNASLLQKCQQKSSQRNTLQEKTKQIASLKWLQQQNYRMAALITRLNKEIQELRSVNKRHQHQAALETQDDSVQTFKENQAEQKSSLVIASLSAQNQKLKEEIEKFATVKAQNQQLKQQRIFRLNQQKQMKRIYREEREDISHIEAQLIQLKERHQKLNNQYDLLKRKYNQIKLQQLQRKSFHSIEGIDPQKENLKKMQQKHRLLERNFQQIKRYNEMIKHQYHKLKEETNNTIRAKIKEILAEREENQVKLRKQVEQFSYKINQYKSKISILQEQNLNLKMHMQTKAQKHDQLRNLKQRPELTHSLNYIHQARQDSEQKQRLKTEIRQIKIKKEQQRIHMINQIRQKEEEISSQRIQILKLEQKLDQALNQASTANPIHFPTIQYVPDNNSNKNERQSKSIK